MAFKKGDKKLPGSGRKRGQLNRQTTALKDAILKAFDDAGGAAYLKKIAETNPAVFCALLGRVLPLTVAGDPANPIPYKVELVFGQAPQAANGGSEN